MAPDWYLKSSYPVFFPTDPLLFVSDEAFKNAIITNPTIKPDDPFAEDLSADDPAAPLTIWKRQVRPPQHLVDSLSKAWGPEPSAPSSRAISEDVQTNLSLFFSHGRRGMHRDHKLLPYAWKEDAKKTLAVIMYARSNQSGYWDPRKFFSACGQIYLKHPKTFLQFIKWIGQPLIRWVPPGDIPNAPEPAQREEGRLPVTEGVPFARWKDLLSLLMLAVNRAFYRDISAFRKILTPTTAPKRAPQWRDIPDDSSDDEWDTAAVNDPFSLENDEALDLQLDDQLPGPGYLSDGDSDYGSETGKMPRLSKQALRAFRHERAVYMFTNDPVYRAFHLTVARMFASQLKKDLNTLEEAEKQGEVPVISHCAKWAPSHDRAHDRSTFIVSSIAEAMFPEDLFTKELEESGLTEMNEDRRTRYLWLARLKYAGVLTRLRKLSGGLHSKLALAADRKIDYATVPPRTLFRLCERFMRNDKDRFSLFLESARAGTGPISIENVTPGQLVPAIFDGHGLRRDIAEIMYQRLVKKTRERRKNELTMVVCSAEDCWAGIFVNHATVVDHTISLMLFMIDCMDNPWNDKVARGGTTPQWVNMQRSEDVESNFFQLVRIVKRDREFNFVRFYELLLLPRLLAAKAAGQPIPTKVIVLTTTRFSKVEAPPNTWGGPQPSSPMWSQSYERLKTLYADNGLEIPEMLHWFTGVEGRRRGGSEMVYTDGVKYLFDGRADCTRAFIEGADMESLTRREKEVTAGSWITQGGEPMTSVKAMENGVADEAYNVFEVFD